MVVDDKGRKYFINLSILDFPLSVPRISFNDPVQSNYVPNFLLAIDPYWNPTVSLVDYFIVVRSFLSQLPEEDEMSDNCDKL